ncbi:hypothetical protein [Methylocella silvestris]|nr:hypothetical protein [Methylocella silvestris]
MKFRLPSIGKRFWPSETRDDQPWTDDDWPIEDSFETVRGAFNLVFETSGVRIFTASLIDASHLWTPLLGEKDVVIFSDPWTSRLEIARAAQAAARFPENLYFLCNDSQSFYLRKRILRNASLVNQNCFLDENLFFVDDRAEKIYDALYNARRSKTKRHYLASEIADVMRLALIYPHHDNGWYDLEEDQLPKHVYRNKANLRIGQVAQVINQSSVGLALSESEGACFASSEYLLCGVPVVSTPSKGGRSFWYDDENALIVDADPHAVFGGVSALIKAPRDPHRIRAAHIALMLRQRQTFLDEVLAPIAARFSLADWDYRSAFHACDLLKEFGFKKDCWRNLDEIRRTLSG